MNYNIQAFFIILLLASCNTKKSNEEASGFEKSFKEQNIQEFNEHIDSITNIYSNFKYNVAYDGPNKWNFDTGVSEHTIYRTYQPDSAISFSINVIEVKKSHLEKKQKMDIWVLYQQNKDQMDKALINLLEEQLNTKAEGFKASKAYLKNNVALKRNLNYMVRNLDYEYNNTTIQYQVLIDNLTFTFGLDIPTMFYQKNPFYYEQLFNNVYFLKNGERLNQLINDPNK
jgi:hypothetical protein